MLIDDITIKVSSGNGGRGAVAFDNNKMGVGPTGGNGGKGGNVYFEGVSDLGALRQFRFKKDLAAENGENGKAKLCDGARGESLTIKVPVGTVIHDLSDSAIAEDYEVTKVGEKFLFAEGGKGGRGNYLFRSSLNTSPRQFKEGLPGKTAALRLELKLIADIGLIGLPNVGKTSLLNELTKASGKVANYQFTTLEPNLGVYYDLILADIPGLIEGASGGKGLGIKFLRHIERTKILFHIIGADSVDPVADYKTVREELGAYNKEMLDKPEYVFLSRSYLVSPADLKKKVMALKKKNKNLEVFSIYDYESVEDVKKILNEIAKEKIKK